MAKKWVYKFSEGRASDRNLLGGKGCNLAEMTYLGMPIPQGFTISTEACTDYYDQKESISQEIQDQIMENRHGLRSSMARSSVILQIPFSFRFVQVPALPCPV